MQRFACHVPLDHIPEGGRPKWKLLCSFLQQVLYSANSLPGTENLIIIIFLREEKNKQIHVD